MAKPKTNFADEDLAIARRALWLLEGHPPGRKQPPLDMDLTRLMSFNGSDGFALPLAHFGVIRYMDAIRVSPPPTTPADDGDSPNPRVAERGQRAAQPEAYFEKRARNHLSEALLNSTNAFEAWQTGTAKRAERWARMPALFPVLSGEHQKILEALATIQQGIGKALVKMDALMRELPPDDAIDSFTSTFGLPLAQRNEALGDQALSLSEAGISVENIGYVMGWNGHTPEHSKDRRRKRLDEARARRRARAP